MSHVTVLRIHCSVFEMAMAQNSSVTYKGRGVCGFVFVWLYNVGMNLSLCVWSTDGLHVWSFLSLSIHLSTHLFSLSSLFLWHFLPLYKNYLTSWAGSRLREKFEFFSAIIIFVPSIYIRGTCNDDTDDWVTGCSHIYRFPLIHANENNACLPLVNAWKDD